MIYRWGLAKGELELLSIIKVKACLYLVGQSMLLLGRFSPPFLIRIWTETDGLSLGGMCMCHCDLRINHRPKDHRKNKEEDRPWQTDSEENKTGEMKHTMVYSGSNLITWYDS